MAHSDLWFDVHTWNKCQRLLDFFRMCWQPHSAATVVPAPSPPSPSSFSPAGCSRATWAMHVQLATAVSGRSSSCGWHKRQQREAKPHDEESRWAAVQGQVAQTPLHPATGMAGRQAGRQAGGRAGGQAGRASPLPGIGPQLASASNACLLPLWSESSPKAAASANDACAAPAACRAAAPAPAAVAPAAVPLPDRRARPRCRCLPRPLPHLLLLPLLLAGQAESGEPRAASGLPPPHHCRCRRHRCCTHQPTYHHCCCCRCRCWG